MANAIKLAMGLHVPYNSTTRPERTGGQVVAHLPYAQWTANKRIKDASATGATILATACPFCEQHLYETTRANNQPIQIIDVAEILFKSLS